MGHHYDDEIQKQLDEAMPWVGLYIAGASAVCTLAMAADAFDGFRRKKLWFPCKYFSLNATSLTMLAVAMKLPVDLNTNMLTSETDWWAKHVSSMFMSTALANFMSSLGTMNNREILANVGALGILVITIAANVWIQLFLLEHVFCELIFIFMTPSVLMLLLLATLVSLAITVPTTKRSLESKYQEKHRVALREEEVLERREAFRIDAQREYMMKYLVMAESSSPQFVMARSAVCTTSAMICLFSVLKLAGMLAGRYIRAFAAGDRLSMPRPVSVYGGYTVWILVIQSIGMVVGLIAPTIRWFVAVSFKCTTPSWKSREVFKIEAYWIQTLVDCRERFSSLQIRQNKCRRYLHDVKWFAITFCIGLQILTVLVSKLLVFLSALLLRLFLLCFTHIKKFTMQHSSKDTITSKQNEDQSSDDTDLNLSRYVLLLEGETELPRRVLKNICLEADDIIDTGRKEQPRSLIDLLQKLVKFHGVGQFDSDEIPSLHDSEEPPYCWTLPVVTLTSIAVALPNIAKGKSKQLLSSVSEGLLLAKIVQKTLVRKAELVNIRKAADICWVGALLYKKWLDIDLKRTSIEGEDSKAVLQELAKKAKGIVMEFKKHQLDSVMENPINWPAKVVAANSMYRISGTILLSCEGEENEQTDEGLFEQLSVMIADILAACLTNLPHAITTMCHRNAIEKRDKSVRKAFLLLGKTEQIVELLQQQKWPSLDHDKTASIEEWRALFRQYEDDRTTPALTSSVETVTACTSSSDEHIAVTVEC